ncbi:MAG TPA: hypothetical protein VMI72_17155 [Roseiarcus sp.]|nr:hypothetical protein [Roseiarcus sp.]
MDRLVVFQMVCAVCAAAVVIGYLLHRHRHTRYGRLIRGPLEEYFAGQMEVGQLGRRARETVGRSYLAGNEFFAEAVAAYQRAMDAVRAKKRPGLNEDKLIRLLAALRNEFGLTERYKNEGWRAGRE